MGIVLQTGDVSISPLKRKCSSLCLASFREDTQFSSQLINHETKNGKWEGPWPWPCQQVPAKGGKITGQQASHPSVLKETLERGDYVLSESYGEGWLVFLSHFPEQKR